MLQGVDEQIHQIAIYNEVISTTVTAEWENASKWIGNNIVGGVGTIVGLDVKHRAPEGGPIALVVLCVNRSCLIYDLLRADSIPVSLARFFSDHNNAFVGVGIDSKLLQLRHEYGFGGRARRLDLRSLAAERHNRPELNNAGLSELRTFLLGGEKDEQRPAVPSDWGLGEELSEDQVRHATIDAYTCYQLGKHLIPTM